VKRLALLFLLVPTCVFASVSGMDDVNPNISPETQQKLDDAITTYYLHPARGQIETVLDIMNNSDLLRRKTAWAPMIGFLTVVFAHNKEHLFAWMSRNDYNTYAEDVFVTSLLHAKLKETALVFAQAHQWKESDIWRLAADYDTVDLKHLAITVPGHIDTLWGAFFASGDPVYVDEIIDVLFQSPPPPPSPIPPRPDEPQPPPPGAFEENKKLAETTLRQYAPLHAPVRHALKARIASCKDKAKRSLLRHILAGASPLKK